MKVIGMMLSFTDDQYEKLKQLSEQTGCTIIDASAAALFDGLNNRLDCFLGLAKENAATRGNDTDSGSKEK